MGSPRWPRTRRVPDSRSVMTAITRRRPWHVGHSKASTERLRRAESPSPPPVHPSLRRVEHPAQEPIPGLHGDDVRRERDDSTGRRRRAQDQAVRDVACGRGRRRMRTGLARRERLRHGSLARRARLRPRHLGLGRRGGLGLLRARGGARIAPLARLRHDLAPPLRARCQHPRKPGQRLPWGTDDRRPTRHEFKPRHHPAITRCLPRLAWRTYLRR